MREPLTAWAGDCMVRGDVDLTDGRLSDQVNELDVLTFFDATLSALDDRRETRLDEVEVERQELHVIEVEGRRGDPARRQRTIQEPVRLQVGPYEIVGRLHRPPAGQPLAAVSGWVRFVPVTEAVLSIAGRDEEPLRREVILVNRERIGRTDPLHEIVVQESEPWPPLPNEEPAAPQG